MQNRIRELRKKAELSMDALAERIGTTRATIMKLEKGNMQLTTRWITRIADGLRCIPEDLISEPQPEEERELIEKYRQLGETEKTMFVHMLDSIVEKKEKPKP